MNAAEQIEEEAHYRRVEEAMMQIDDAARRVRRAAEDLTKEGAPSHLIEALETSSNALSDEHKRLIRAAYWGTPGNGQQELGPAAEQRRLAS